MVTFPCSGAASAPSMGSTLVSCCPGQEPSCPIPNNPLGLLHIRGMLGGEIIREITQGLEKVVSHPKASLLELNSLHRCRHLGLDLGLQA